MNANQLKNYRLAILRILDRNPTSRLFGLTSIALFLREFGFKSEPAEVLRELAYLEGEPLGYVQPVDARDFSPECRAWRITTRGMNFLALEAGE